MSQLTATGAVFPNGLNRPLGVREIYAVLMPTNIHPPNGLLSLSVRGFKHSHPERCHPYGCRILENIGALQLCEMKT
jgi:hypothetical protein